LKKIGSTGLRRSFRLSKKVYSWAPGVTFLSEDTGPCPPLGKEKGGGDLTCFIDVSTVKGKRHKSRLEATQTGESRPHNWACPVAEGELTAESFKGFSLCEGGKPLYRSKGG